MGIGDWGLGQIQKEYIKKYNLINIINMVVFGSAYFYVR